jgi:hypothetical protein
MPAKPRALSAAAAAVPSDDAIVDPRASSCGAFDRKPRLIGRRIPRRAGITRRAASSTAFRRCKLVASKKKRRAFIFSKQLVARVLFS